MNMVFTKMSVRITRSKKSISQVQSAEKVGLTQVQSADTAVELVTMPDSDQKRGATMPSFDQKRGATMPDFDQKRGATKFDFGQKLGAKLKSEYLKIPLLMRPWRVQNSGILLSCLLLAITSQLVGASRASEDYHRRERYVNPIRPRLTALDTERGQGRRLGSRRRLVERHIIGDVGSAKKRGGNTSAWTGSKGYNERFFKITKDMTKSNEKSLELSYYEDREQTEPKKEKDALKIVPGPRPECGLYFHFHGLRGHKLLVWSAGLVNHKEFRTLADIAKKAIRIGDTQWVQYLKFAPKNGRSADQLRNQFVLNIRNALPSSFRVRQIDNDADWHRYRTKVLQEDELRQAMLISLRHRIDTGAAALVDWNEDPTSGGDDQDAPSAIGYHTRGD